MPKVYGTRAQETAELKRLLKNGPSFSLFSESISQRDEYPELSNISQKQFAMIDKLAAHQYQRWSESWVLGSADELLPKPKPKK